MINIKKIIKDNKGFSLVELIVVIAIMVILISALVSRMVGYVKKAEEISAMNTLKVMVDSMEVSLVEHAMENEMRPDKQYSYYSDGKFIPAGCLTNYTLSTVQKMPTIDKSRLTSGQLADIHDLYIAKEMLEAVRCEYGAKNPKLVFSDGSKPWNQNPREYKKTHSGKDGALFVYALGGGVLAAQITVGNYLVTYRNGNYTVQHGSDPTAKFFGAEVVNRNGSTW